MPTKYYTNHSSLPIIILLRTWLIMRVILKSHIVHLTDNFLLESMDLPGNCLEYLVILEEVGELGDVARVHGVHGALPFLQQAHEEVELVAHLLAWIIIIVG